MQLKYNLNRLYAFVSLRVLQAPVTSLQLDSDCDVTFPTKKKDTHLLRSQVLTAASMKTTEYLQTKHLFPTLQMQRSNETKVAGNR
jgi:hypothetical protein